MATIDKRMKSESSKNCSVSSKVQSLSSRLIRRVLFYRKHVGTDKIVYKSSSDYIVNYPILKASIDPMPKKEATAICVETPIATHLTKPHGWPEKGVNSLPDSSDFAICWSQFEKGLVPKVQLSSGATVYFTTPQELLDYWNKAYWPKPMSIVKGWVNKSESVGLVGGGKRSNRKGRKRRPNRQNQRRSPTTNREMVTSNLSIPRSLPPQYSRNSWSYISSVSSDASGKFNFYCNIRNPAKAINGSGQYTRAVEDAKIWDGYYVKAFMLQMVPIIPTTVTAGLVIGAVDQEGTAPVTTPTYDTLIDRRYRFMFGGRQSKTTTIRPKPLTSGTFEGRVCPILESGRKIFYDYEFPPDQGIMEVAGEGFPASSALFQIFLWMEVVNFSPRTLPGIAPRVVANTVDGKYVPNPLPVLPLRRRNSC